MHPKATTASCLVSVVFVSVAAAQEPPPPTTTTVSNSAGISASTSPGAPGGGGPDSIGTAFGVGAQALLTGPVGPALVYNMNRFHIEGVFAFSDIANANSFTIAGRAWLHVHNSPSATLSLGGGGGLQSVEHPAGMAGGMSTKDSNLLLEGGAQIRFFATRNVAISASAGLALVTGDGDSTAVTGQVTGAFGITYFLY
jgi:hypothetical protein